MRVAHLTALLSPCGPGPWWAQGQVVTTGTSWLPSLRNGTHPAPPPRSAVCVGEEASSIRVSVDQGRTGQKDQDQTVVPTQLWQGGGAKVHLQTQRLS
jgi:hypothetical protein